MEYNKKLITILINTNYKFNNLEYNWKINYNFN